MNKLSKIIVIIIWIIAIYLWVASGFWYVVAGLFTLHLVEVFRKGIPIGTKEGKTKCYSAIMTLIFGFAWWMQLQNKNE